MSPNAVVYIQSIIFICLYIYVKREDSYQMHGLLSSVVGNAKAQDMQRSVDDLMAGDDSLAGDEVQDISPAYIHIAFLLLALLMFCNYYFVLGMAAHQEGTFIQMYSKIFITFAVVLALIGGIVAAGIGLQKNPAIIPFIFSLLKLVMLVGALYCMVKLLPKSIPVPSFGDNSEGFSKLVLLVEFIVVFVYFAAPYVLRFALSRKGKIVLTGPIYLDDVRSLEVTKHADPDYRYAMSAWFYINPQPDNTREAFTKFTNIITRDDNPLVQYNSSTRSLRISAYTMDESRETIYEKDNIPLQKWNYLVVNYDGGTMDIFLNGNLVISKPRLIPADSSSTAMVRVGEVNGLEGGICNVVCYDEPITNEDIAFQYELLKEYHQPVV